MDFEEVSPEKIFEEFDPYFCYALMSCIPQFKANLERRKFVEFLKEKYRNDKEFEEKCKKRLLEPFDPSRKIEDNVLKRVRELNLLYTLKYSYEPPLRIESKVTGRCLELLVEAVLKAGLEDNCRLGYEFVDWKSFDYVIVDRFTNDWIAGIQSKIAFVNYKKAIEKMKEFAKLFPTDKRFIMFCGGARGYEKKLEIRQSLETEGWELYYLWTDIKEYEIDDSFYRFIETIATYR